MWIKYYQDVEEKKAKQYDPEKLHSVCILKIIPNLSIWSGIQSIKRSWNNQSSSTSPVHLVQDLESLHLIL